MKYCPRCKTEKPVEKFGRDRSSKDGISFYCSECKRRMCKERYVPHPRKPKPPKTEAEIQTQIEKRREWDRQRYKRDKEKRLAALKERYKIVKSHKKKYNHEYRQREKVKASERKRTRVRYHAPENRQKNKARQAVNNAVAAGRLPKVSTLICAFEDCQKHAREYHHFLGYSDTHMFEVIPLCYSHHREVDAFSET